MDPSSQRVTVIGAGVTGVTTAYALARRGFQVTVVEKLEGPALETSRANAGQRSYGYVYPWASPSMLRHALPWLVRTDGPLKMALPPSRATWQFLAQTLRFMLIRDRYTENKRAMLELGKYSRECFLALERELDLSFDGEHRGLINIASNRETFSELQKTANLLAELNIPGRLLSPDQLLQLEPGLTGPAPVYGALQVENDGTGDCHNFTRALAEQCEKLGVTFRFGATVAGVEWQGNRIRALRLAAEDGPELQQADQFVLCAGCASRSLGAQLGEQLPIYPVKGYSLTAPLRDPDRSPVSTVVDDRYKVVATRLGGRLRVTGFVELADLDRRIPPERLRTLRRAVDSRFPGAADLNNAEPWTGFRPMTPDGPPIIGPGRAPNLFLNTGHGTFGWTLSAASAELTAQSLSGERPALSLTAFAPGRF